MTEQTTTPDPAPATYPPDMRLSQILGMAIDAHRHTRIGGGDPGDPASFIARWLVEQDYVLRSTIPGPGSPVEEITAAMRADALSGLLRGMARRLAKHRIAFTDLRLHLARAGHKIALELEEARAELARVRPVVDAARAWCEGRAPSSAVYDAVAALDGDAAATPQPAATTAERLSVSEQCVALAYTGNAYGLLDQIGVRSTHRESALLDRLHEGGYELVRRAAVSSAPPLDVAARLAAAADALDAIGWAGLGYDMRDVASQLTPGAPNSDGGVEAAAAVVARALATPATDTPGEDR